MIVVVIRLMNKSFALLLIVLCGCNASSENNAERNSQGINSPAAVNGSNVVPTIYAVPRPNSGKFSTEEAKALLPQFLKRSIPILKTDTIVTKWESPTQGIRIHVAVDDTIEIIDYLGRNLIGLDSIDDALDSTMTYGNEQSVLLTSETDNWDSPDKKAVIDALFQPSVQIYLVGNGDG